MQYHVHIDVLDFIKRSRGTTIYPSIAYEMDYINQP